PLSLGANDCAAGTEYTDLAAINHFHTNAIGLAGFGIVDGHIGNVDGHGLVDDAALRAGHGIGLDMLLDDVDAFDQNVVGVHTLQDGAAALFVATGQHDDLVAFTDFFHAFAPYSTSGARDTIFMNFSVRSSRVTGPKIRVPMGSSLALSNTAALPP